jgi:hypothetical protein
MDYLKREYILKNTRGEFYGKSGWIQNMSEATRWGAEDCLSMLAAFSGSTAMAITTRGQDRRQHSIVRSGADRREQVVAL